MYLWAAISAAADGDFPVPDWTTPYFRVAARLYAVSLSQVPDEQIGPALYRALEFTGHAGNALHTIPDTSHDAEIAAAVEFELNGKEGGFGAALPAVVREHPSECQASPKCERIQRTRVNRLWRQYRPQRKR
jgi:hypothetical protein